MMGVSRSATVVCAYLIATAAMSATEAIAFVTERREVASPNIGFRRQLETYAIRLAGKEVQVGRSLRSRVKKLQEQLTGDSEATSLAKE